MIKIPKEINHNKWADKITENIGKLVCIPSGEGIRIQIVENIQLALDNAWEEGFNNAKEQSDNFYKPQIEQLQKERDDLEGLKKTLFSEHRSDMSLVKELQRLLKEEKQESLNLSKAVGRLMKEKRELTNANITRMRIIEDGGKQLENIFKDFDILLENFFEELGKTNLLDKKELVELGKKYDRALMKIKKIYLGDK